MLVWGGNSDSVDLDALFGERGQLRGIDRARDAPASEDVGKARLAALRELRGGKPGALVGGRGQIEGWERLADEGARNLTVCRPIEPDNDKREEARKQAQRKPYGEARTLCRLSAHRPCRSRPQAILSVATSRSTSRPTRPTSASRPPSPTRPPPYPITGHNGDHPQPHPQTRESAPGNGMQPEAGAGSCPRCRLPPARRRPGHAKTLAK